MTMEIRLKAELSKEEYSVYNEGIWNVTDEYEYTAELGEVKISVFFDWEIVKIDASEIVFQNGNKTKILHPGEHIVLFENVEGSEWSDGSVYNGTNYSLKIIWPI